MKIIKKILPLVFIAFLLMAGNALALTFSDVTNITIFDKSGNESDGSGKGGEDNETEPGMINNQDWDLEGFFLEGTTLTMVGGFDFVNGNSGYTSGDIFIDIDGDVTDPAGTSYDSIEITNSFGYDYVLDLNVADKKYNVYEINDSTMVITAYYEDNDGSNPWKYSSGGDKRESDVAFLAYETNLTNNNTGFLGDDDNNSHYALSVNLGFLEPGQDFTAHFTMGCGNDNLMGFGTTTHAPEPATMLLFGVGLLGMTVAQRKKVLTLKK